MHKVNVFITIDTEHSIGGAFRDIRFKPVGSNRRIFCKSSKGDYGIPLIMSIAETYGHRLSFFLEVLNKYYFGEDTSRYVCDYILNRGHDVQLHLHPNYLNFKTNNPSERKFKDNMHAYNLSKQIELIADGKESLIRCGVNRPVAFRAGNYAADLNTINALESCGFIFDTSYNKTFETKSIMLCDSFINDVRLIGKILELPITNFIERIGFNSRYRPLDINGASFRQFRYVLEQAYTNKTNCITIVLHSFSFVKALDFQYKRAHFRKIVINRFIRLCKFLAENQDRFLVKTFDNLRKKDFQNLLPGKRHFLPKTNTILSFERNIEQCIDLIPFNKTIKMDSSLK